MISDSAFFGSVKTVPSDRLEKFHSSEGGWAELYLSDKDGKFRVFKTLKAEFRGDFLYETILRKEYEVSYMLNHPCICETYNYFFHPQLGNCIEMEWIDGVTLSDLQKRGALTAEQSRQVIIQLCDALSYCHSKQVIHKDIKPENIMLTHNGMHVKLIDFGLADSSAHSILKSPCGTLHYVAPELLNGGAADDRSDIYSLGKVIEGLDPAFSKVARRCCRKNPAERFNSVQDVKTAAMKVGEREGKGSMKVLAALVTLLVCSAVLYFSRKPEQSSPAGESYLTDSIYADTVPGPITVPGSALNSNVKTKQKIETRHLKADTSFFVDLGLSVLWAKSNIKADILNANDSDTKFFFWGGTEPRTRYSWNSYSMCRININVLKYNSSDGKITLDPEDDAATANLGPKWRTPTREEWKELSRNCVLTIDTLAQFIGCRLTSKRQGYTDKSIFLPFRRTDSDISSYACYQSSSIVPDDPAREYHVHLDSKRANPLPIGTGGRKSKCRVRPVTSECLEDAVDLGLSVKWSTRNIGAGSDEEIGSTFMFGHTERYKKGQSYAFFQSDTVFLKYVSSEKNGVVDNLTRLETGDDAAALRLGPGSRIPTGEEFNELVRNCSFEWTIRDGKEGCLFTSKVPGYEGSSIFLAADGYCRFDREVRNVCRYWASTKQGNDFTADVFNATPAGCRILQCNRSFGCPIRPVRERNPESQ